MTGSVPESAYGPWRSRVYFGPTPSRSEAGITMSAIEQIRQDDWPALWRVGRTIIWQQSALEPGFGKVERVAQAMADHSDPLSGWVLAFLGAFDVTMWPVRVSRSDGSVNVESNAPYHEGVSRVVDLCGALLGACAKSLARGRVEIDSVEFAHLFRLAGTLFPAPSLMTMHRELRELGVTFEWLGGDLTRVGQGSRQCIFNGQTDRAGRLTLADVRADRDCVRIPIYTVTGSTGKTSTVRLLGQLLGEGQGLGLAASDGAWSCGRQIASGDCIGGAAAVAMLKRQDVDVALFEQGRGGLIRQGVPYARSDIAVLLNIQPVHLGLDGVVSVADMADVKALGLRPASIVVLNREDAQCRRLGEMRDPGVCAWFSTRASSSELCELSTRCRGSAGARRDVSGVPVALELWRDGHCAEVLSLDGVAPYHGTLLEKTLEELLAAVTAAWLGPVRRHGLQTLLPSLSLNSRNHVFRTSVHRRGNTVFILDKAAEGQTLELLGDAIQEICRREGIEHRLGVLTRPASDFPERHREGCISCYRYLDEFLIFDRPDTYGLPTALPQYVPGSIPILLRDEFLALNGRSGIDKPVVIVDEWETAARMIDAWTAQATRKCLVLINQPSTSVADLNRRIVAFVEGFEAGTPVALPRIQADFKQSNLAVKPDGLLPF